MTKKVFASSGNRTRAARVAGEHSTTEPTMLVDFVAMQQCSSCGRVVKATDSKSVSLWEHRFESCQLRQRLFLDDIDVSPLSILPVLSLASSHRFLDSLVVRISACHVEGPGSIPGRGEIFSLLTKSFVAPGEARTHNPGITLCTVYKYRALTDCATGAYWQKGLMQGVGFEPTQSYDYESLNLTP